MNQNIKKPPQLVELSVQVDEIIRFCESTQNRQEANTKELFRQGGYFFMFVTKRKNQNYSYTLNELHSKTFFRHKQELLSKRPHKGCEFWSQNGLKYKLKCCSRRKWKATVDKNRCYFLKESASNLIFKAYQEAQIQDALTKPEPLLPQIKRKDSSMFVQLSEAYDIDYENVVCLGTNPQTLKKFQQTYQEAIAKVSNLPIVEQYKLYKALSPGKPYAITKEAIKKLQIDCGNADLRQMNFSKLIFALKEHVDHYRTEAINLAMTNALSLEPEAQKLLYQKLVSYTNKEKTDILRELGINPNALDVRKFNITPIKKALAKLLYKAN